MILGRNSLWISYSAICDFEKCKRAYYYKHIYRNHKNNNRIQIVNPYLSLGSIVHEAIEGVAGFSVEERNKTSLVKRYNSFWKNYTGKKGGFISEKQEKEFKERGLKMVKRAEKSPIIKKPAYNTNSGLPKMNLFPGVELVGNIDWIEILPSKKLHIIDFKTGKNEENGNSLQLPIYYLLAKNNIKEEIEKVSYWYLDKDNDPVSQELNFNEDYLKIVKEKAKNIMNAVENKDFKCSSGYRNCFCCRDFDSVFSGEAEYVGYDDKMKKELYYIVKEDNVIKKISEGTFLDSIEKKIFEERITGSLVNYNSETLEDIKKKIKDNLSNKELRAFINKINKA